ncbi:MAG: alkaline phosphatase family protein [Candidatus Cryptobacteroides sp.]|nr:alkaline phosphatase family protein [Bacteroidales bacterium]
MIRYIIPATLIVLISSCAPKNHFANNESPVRKAVYVVIDGVPADMIERLDLPNIQEIASKGSYGRSYVGGTVGHYDETPTISAVGYMDILTGTWVNKHNVPGNSNLEPNYNYWSLFRIAKEQDREVKTGLFSSWTDNRTVLIGEGKPDTDSLTIDYVFDGYDADYDSFPIKEHELRIFDIDEHVSKMAALCIRNEAPDLSWVYLWYTDDAGHIFGNGSIFDEFTKLADVQIGRVWDAVKYRESNYNEEWMIIVTTDHGRDYKGYHHGGQSERERTTWIAANRPMNERMASGKCAATDINPSICKWMGFEVPREVEREQDGTSFYGQSDIMEMEVYPYDNTVELTWECLNEDATVSVWATTTNNFKIGAKDEWVKIGETNASDESYSVDLSSLPESDFYKFVIETPNGSLNRWYSCSAEKYTSFKIPVEYYGVQ